MADVSDKTLSEWAQEVKDDLNPVSWLVYGYSGKSKIVPRVKGSGEAEGYWEEFRAHLSEDQLLFALVRIIMGDAESRRPKFVFIIWLGRNVGVMQKARVGMEKNDIKRVVGAIHLEIETDDTREIELDAVKKQLKKSMGADYDMGSNSRSASGKEGNADKAAGAEVKYTSQQSAIKAKAAAAYEGGHTVKVSGGIGSLGGTNATEHAVVTTCMAPVATYRCVKKSQCRSSFEMDSDKTAVITVGTSVAVTERRPNDSGTLRLKITQGWVSEKTGAGALCFHLISETAPINAPAPQVNALSASGPPTAFRCVKKSQIRAGFEMDSDKAGILEVGTEIKAMATQTNDKGVLRVQFEGGWVSERAGNGAVCLQATAWGDAVEPPAPQEAAASQPSEVVVAEEAPTATVAKQEEAAVVEEEAEAAAGAVGAHEEAPAGEEASPAEEQVAADDNEAAAVAAAAQEKSLAEEAATAEADKASLAKEQVAATEAAAVEQVVADEAPTPSGCCVYRSAKCVKKSQIRAGFDMASDKAGIISVGTVIDVIETRPNDAGTLRIHFSGGWVSEHAGNGATCFELVRNDLGAPPSFKAPEPAQLASAPEPAPEPTPVPEAPLVVSVTEEDVALGEYKCLHAAVIREGSGMDTSKAGTLDVGERIDVLETHTLETGLVRCRFKDGWVSAQLHGGEPILERTLETSGETVKCGECTLSKEAYAICRKMARTSKMKNKAIIMKINLKKMEIVLVDELDDVTPEDIAEEFEDFEPRYCMYMYEYVRDDGRVTYPLCFIWYNPSGCDVHLNMIYGQTTEALIELLKASKTFNVQEADELTSEWLRAEVQKGSGVK